MNRLFLHESYKDKTDEELIALRKQGFNLTYESVIDATTAQNYYEYLCVPPNTDWDDQTAFNNLYRQVDAHCHKIRYYDAEHDPDGGRWTSIHGLIEIMNDYPELTALNVDFENISLDHRADKDMLDIVYGINDLNKRIDFLSFYGKHFNIFSYHSCFHDDEGKPNKPYIDSFKENLRVLAARYKDQLKHQQPTKKEKDMSNITYNNCTIQIKQQVNEGGHGVFNDYGDSEQTVTLPAELATEKAKKLWQIAQDEGWIDKNYQPTISESKATILADAMGAKLKLTERWKDFTELWDIKDMSKKLDKALSYPGTREFIGQVAEKITNANL